MIRVDSLVVFETDGSFELAAAQAGHPLPALLDRILAVARERYRIGQPPDSARAGQTAWNPDAEGRPVVAG